VQNYQTAMITSRSKRRSSARSSKRKARPRRVEVATRLWSAAVLYRF